MTFSRQCLTDQISIIIADDHPVIRQGLTTILNSQRDCASSLRQRRHREAPCESAEAQAQLKVAEAARDLAEVTYKRDQDLFKTNVISAQDFDTATENYKGELSTVIADEAVVGRLEVLEAFKIVRAPFDGIVTARNTDIGDYVAAGLGVRIFGNRIWTFTGVPRPLGWVLTNAIPANAISSIRSLPPPWD
jgi:multidrug efflux pump subunit AcrA (membrane-fusion protein)